MNIQPVILAAGQGKRMYSALPKVLHHLAGKPLLEHVIHSAQAVAADAAPIVIFGHQGEEVRQALNSHPVTWVEQTKQLGTGHAVMQALPMIDDNAQVLVLYGDVPFISVETLKNLITSSANGMAVLTAHLSQPKGYGRIVRNQQHHIISIVEEKDATDEQRNIQEINSGIYCIPAKYLKSWLPQLKNENAQGEYYLTDVISLAVKDKVEVNSVQPVHQEEILGINDKVQLAALERIYQQHYAEKLMRAGVTVLDPARLDIRGHLQAGRDVVLDVNVIIEGNVTLGDGCKVGAHCILKNVSVRAGTEIKPHSILEDATIGMNCVIGPFARIRPGTSLANEVHVGNFVEVKNSALGTQTKVNHLSYVGDSTVGQRVNVGAGTITCNYDGANKHRTVIEDDVHIGSDTQLVAPVTVGAGATIAAGSTITKDVASQTLTLTQRLEQRSLKDWQRPKKQS